MQNRSTPVLYIKSYSKLSSKKASLPSFLSTFPPNVSSLPTKPLNSKENE